jgi:mercuric ion transport protein
MPCQALNQTRPERSSRNGGSPLLLQTLATTGGLLGALAASSCCIAPLVLFALGVSGAWISNLTQLAPYQPYLIGAALACVGYGYWLVRPSRMRACADGRACARPLPYRTVRIGLLLATGLIIAVLAFDFVVPLIFV